jgi:hypothetical protein
MKMKSKRRVERDRARRDPRSRLGVPQTEAAGDIETDFDDATDTEVARSLLGYDE